MIRWIRLPIFAYVLATYLPVCREQLGSKGLEAGGVSLIERHIFMGVTEGRVCSARVDGVERCDFE